MLSCGCQGVCVSICTHTSGFTVCLVGGYGFRGLCSCYFSYFSPLIVDVVLDVSTHPGGGGGGGFHYNSLFCVCVFSLNVYFYYLVLFTGCLRFYSRYYVALSSSSPGLLGFYLNSVEYESLSALYIRVLALQP